MMAVGKNKSLVFFLFFSALFLAYPGRSTALVGDSVGEQIVNGKRFLIHRAGPKETHYELARRYHVPVKQIIAANPEDKAGLKAGQLVYIPRKAAANKGKATTTPLKPYARTDEKGNKIHLVADKQTLFAIARQYQVSSTDLKKWNNLASDQVKAGQHLIVAAPAKAENKPTLPTQLTPEMEPIIVKNTEPEMVSASLATRTISSVSESGIAEIINADVNKFLALHHTAPVGTYITVTNPMNGRSVSARVIGRLPETGANEKIIVKLSQRAQRQLGALDNRFRVEVSYMPEQ